MTKKSSSPTTNSKPAKPRKDYPLFAHGNGQWAKKVRGKLHYFGGWDDPKTALDEWLRVKNELLAGRRPREKREGLTLREGANLFLNAQRERVELGELSARSHGDYIRCCDLVLKRFGKSRVVEDLDMKDFAELRRYFARKGWGPVTIKGRVTVTKIFFRWLYDNGHIEHPVRFGGAFKPPSQKVIRQRRVENGEKLFTRDEILSLMESTTPQMRAMILLGVNCGMGNSDISNLTTKHLDLDGGWVDYPRPKTAVGRRCKLWPETVEALREVLANRKEPKSEEDKHIVFLTRFRQRWVRISKSATPIDGVSREFGKLKADVLGNHTGRGFYCLRHVFQTVADECRDPVAIMHVMGHSDNSMSSIYREKVSDERLERVAQTVHDWLYPPKKEGEADE